MSQNALLKTIRHAAIQRKSASRRLTAARVTLALLGALLLTCSLGIFPASAQAQNKKAPLGSLHVQDHTGNPRADIFGVSPSHTLLHWVEQSGTFSAPED